MTREPIIIDTTGPPSVPARKVADPKPPLLLGEHSLCPGCGEPVALRLLLEVLQELDIVQRTIGVVGHGCYGSFVRIMDVDVLQCLHGRAPSCATGIKRVRPECAVFTMQGDGDMANEGLQEVLHAAARGERITCVLLNNGVFGDTGGQLTATTVLGQRTKTSLAGREAETHGYPIPVADLVASLQGTAYVARGTVSTAGGVAQTRRMLRKAFEAQLAGAGFSLVEILTMCPTGWFVPTAEGPGYLGGSLEQTYPLGELVT
ncbi:thiamine pyrophosphate-dependent enzyme [Micromonospora sp. DSM 115977]|uniref:Thiamine pyrophosphate-dependent enzyme n=1 Tax=Micromonospora reichwaldensis TaxID=3075516 RepID=A0ABU2WXE3_9ACTN|nr:thiamine pyrophosphate-dependent enzyme [Micromonospora sp. DSM 115977]MDT0530552.1 thiamine pyrophosphate-dependent enzyme [Micromonospora sp. DSM 115977]